MPAHFKQLGDRIPRRPVLESIAAQLFGERHRRSSITPPSRSVHSETGRPAPPAHTQVTSQSAASRRRRPLGFDGDLLQYKTFSDLSVVRLRSLTTSSTRADSPRRPAKARRRRLTVRRRRPAATSADRNVTPSGLGTVTWRGGCLIGGQEQSGVSSAGDEGGPAGDAGAWHRCSARPTPPGRSPLGHPSSACRALAGFSRRGVNHISHHLGTAETKVTARFGSWGLHSVTRRHWFVYQLQLRLQTFGQHNSGRAAFLIGILQVNTASNGTPT